ncbi:methionyl-tRNA formyltransferase, partial [Candidatus Wolfebacteria bacterium]|nr:methionyl-tRNA formyltransferase [Candidatus Wolfebacteria bacterium]
MKFIFFGTPEFAAIILEKLIQAELMPEAVICNPDKPTGRKQ